MVRILKIVSSSISEKEYFVASLGDFRIRLYLTMEIADLIPEAKRYSARKYEREDQILILG